MIGYGGRDIHSKYPSYNWRKLGIRDFGIRWSNSGRVRFEHSLYADIAPFKWSSFSGGTTLKETESYSDVALFFIYLPKCRHCMLWQRL